MCVYGGMAVCVCMRGWQYVCILGDGSMCVYEGV